MPLISSGVMYEYLLAGNGLFVRGQRDGLRLTLHLHEFNVRGLPVLQPGCELLYPKVPASLLQEILDESLEARDGRGATEIAFHLAYDQGWQLMIPDWEFSGMLVKPRGAALGTSYATALVEVHSHHGMEPVFSRIDDRDEVGFRLYGVIGNIFTEPALRVRAGLYGYRWEIPASLIFDLPPAIRDCVADETPSASVQAAAPWRWPDWLADLLNW
jgi:hypothetical protein